MSGQLVPGRRMRLVLAPTSDLGMSSSGSTQSLDPSGWNSFFQIGTVDFTRSIAARHASNASERCGATAAIATDGSPTARRPTRCFIRTRASGNSRRSASAIRPISDSAIGP